MGIFLQGLHSSPSRVRDRLGKGASAMMVEILDELAQWLLESANQRGISIRDLLAELLIERQTARLYRSF